MRKALRVCVILTTVLLAFSTAVIATCSVSQQCPNGSTVSCSGPTGTCTTGSNYVQCNGNRTYCASQPQPCGISYTCEYGGELICSSSTGRCYTFENETFGCDDKVMSCAECYPRFFCNF